MMRTKQLLISLPAIATTWTCKLWFYTFLLQLGVFAKKGQFWFVFNFFSIIVYWQTITGNKRSFSFPSSYEWFVFVLFWNFYCAVVSFIPNDYPYKNAHFCCCCFFGFLLNLILFSFCLFYILFLKMCWLKRSFSSYGDGMYLTHTHIHILNTTCCNIICIFLRCTQ